jgi:hypothetical protein
MLRVIRQLSGYTFLLQPRARGRGWRYGKVNFEARQPRGNFTNTVLHPHSHYHT